MASFVFNACPPLKKSRTKNEESKNPSLVGGFNPFEKYAHQIGNLSPNRGENKEYLKPPPRSILSLHFGMICNNPHPLQVGSARTQLLALPSFGWYHLTRAHHAASCEYPAGQKFNSDPIFTGIRKKMWFLFIRKMILDLITFKGKFLL